MTTWIFLRGLTRASHHWGAFPEIFRARIEHAYVIALDLPGNGSLNRMQSPLSVEAMAEYCRLELARRGHRPPYHLLAMSLGAMVAVAWATTHPEEIQACVLINTSLRSVSPFYRRLRPANYGALLKLLLTHAGPEAWEKFALEITSRRVESAASAESRAEILHDWIDYHRKFPVSRCNATRQLLAAIRYRAPPGRPASRMLLLASARDALVNPDCSKRLADEWQADIAEHPDAGHDIPLDDALWVARQVHDWL